jgi:hypothetical protein
VKTLTEIPCFVCLFWDWKKESHLYCNPRECEKLTNWLLKQAENDENDQATLIAETTLKECSS